MQLILSCWPPTGMSLTASSALAVAKRRQVAYCYVMQCSAKERPPLSKGDTARAKFGDQIMAVLLNNITQNMIVSFYYQTS